MLVVCGPYCLLKRDLIIGGNVHLEGPLLCLEEPIPCEGGEGLDSTQGLVPQLLLFDEDPIYDTCALSAQAVVAATAEDLALWAAGQPMMGALEQSHVAYPLKRRD